MGLERTDAESPSVADVSEKRCLSRMRTAQLSRMLSCDMFIHGSRERPKQLLARRSQGFMLMFILL
jgi:hypothetical protein